MRSLNSGPAYIQIFDGNATTRVIWNLDLSVQRTLNYGAPPEGMQWSFMFYVTEALFDTDPSTVEFLMTAYSPGAGATAVFVFREDGTQIFSQSPGDFSGAFGGDVAFNGSPIYFVGETTYMVITEPEMGFSTTYELPGTLPCLNCFGWPNALVAEVGIEENDMDAGDMHLAPNPAQSQVTITLDEDLVATVDKVSLWDARGRQMKQQRLSGDRSVLQIEDPAAGAYSVVLTSEGQHLRSATLVITR